MVALPALVALLIAVIAVCLSALLVVGARAIRRRRDRRRDTLILGPEDALLDGQHRLSAIIEDAGRVS